MYYHLHVWANTNKIVPLLVSVCLLDILIQVWNKSNQTWENTDLLRIIRKLPDRDFRCFQAFGCQYLDLYKFFGYNVFKLFYRSPREDSEKAIKTLVKNASFRRYKPKTVFWAIKNFRNLLRLNENFQKYFFLYSFIDRECP